MALVLAASATSLLHSASGQGRIANMVRLAKASGEGAVIVRDPLPHEEGISTTADELARLKRHLVILVTPRRLRVSQVGFPSESPEGILTWNTFEVLEELNRPAPDYRDPSCDDWETPDPGFKVEGSEIPIFFLGGTLEVDGVTITLGFQDEVEFVAGAKYILLAARCSDGIVRLPDGPRGVFRVESDGLLVAAKGRYVLPQMQSLQRLRDTLLSLK
jgi:hypothetical protein